MSLMTEKATVELVELFINAMPISPNDEDGERLFRLPHEQIDESNSKLELQLPIDKFDWLSFETVFQQAYQYPESDREKLCS